MPDQRFAVRWPDGTRETCYSPSTIVRAHFVPGTEYPLAEFLRRSRDALAAASERVRAVRGAPCPLALAQLAGIEARGARFADEAAAHVLFESFEDNAA